MIAKYLLPQLKILLISLLGIISVIPGPNKTGERRIKGALGNAITYLGLGFLLIPWIIIPFLNQPRFVALPRVIMTAIGVFSVLGGMILYCFSLKHLLPSFRKEFSEFTPEKLITDGPYRYVRNPIYLSAFIIISGLYLLRGASISILFLPFLYLGFKSISIYEEKAILQPKFKTDFLNYKERVKASILGLKGEIIIAVIYLILIAFYNKMININFIK